MKLGTVSTVVVIFVAMISAAMAYRFLVMEPSEGIQESSIAETTGNEKKGDPVSSATDRSHNSKTMPSHGRLDGKISDLIKQNILGSESKKWSVQSDTSRENPQNNIGVRQARLSEDNSGATRSKVGSSSTETLPSQGNQSKSNLNRAVTTRRPKFDVIRVAPDGVSVFAGQAEPGAKVNVIVNGESIGEAVADGDGAWSVVTVLTEHHRDMELRLRAQKGSSRVAEIATPVRVEKIVSSGKNLSPAKTVLSRSRIASETDGKQYREKEKTIRKKRVLDDKTVIRNVDDASNRKMALGPMIDAPRISAEGKPIIVETKQEGIVIASPVPINFIYKEAIFTDDGKSAVSALLEFITKKKLNKIVLSGHTDERGSEEFNMILSEDRLVAVSTYLRSNGYTGDIELRPMGEIRPMQIRHSGDYSNEEIWQFHRRVELEGSE